MSLPRAVLEAEEKADKAYEEFLKQQQNTENGDPPASDPPPSDPPAADPVPPADLNGSANPQPGIEDTSEHRFKVLQGKYNSEVPRLNAENKDLKSQLQQMQHDLEVLKNSKPLEALVKPEEIEQYGEGLIDVARRIAREELASKDAEIQTLKTRLDSLSTTTTQNVEASFFKSLHEMVPDWEQVNQDPKFLTWLDEVDELTGETRQQLLSRAEKGRDAARTAKFFNAYKKTSSSWAANTVQALESQVAPSTNKAPNAPPAKKIWTRAEVADFYAKSRRGDIKDEDVIAIEADIMSAQIEGRMR
jgi:hypothetical protein